MIDLKKVQKKIVSSKVKVNHEDGITTYLYENGRKKYRIVEKSLEISPARMKQLRKTFPIGFTGEHFEKISYNGKFDIYLPAIIDEYTKKFVSKEPEINYICYESLDQNEVKQELIIFNDKELGGIRVEYSYGDHFLEMIYIKVVDGNIQIERIIDSKQKAIVILSNSNHNQYDVTYDLIDCRGKKLAHSSYKVEKSELDLVKLFAL